MATYNVQAVTPLALSKLEGTANASDALGKRRGIADDEDDFFGDESIW